MANVQEILMQWRNGNRVDALRKLAKMDADKVREFTIYLSRDDKETALIIALELMEKE